MKGLIKAIALASAIGIGSSGLDEKAEAQSPVLVYPGYAQTYITAPATVVVPTVPRVVPTGPAVPYIRSRTGPLGLFTWTSVEWVSPAAVVQVPNWSRAYTVINPQLQQNIQQPVQQPAYALPQKRSIGIKIEWR